MVEKQKLICLDQIQVERARQILKYQSEADLSVRTVIAVYTQPPGKHHHFKN